MSAGEVILVLDTDQSQAELTKLQARYASLTALKARLDAERSDGKRGLEQLNLEGVLSEQTQGIDNTTTNSISSSLVTLRDGSGNMVSKTLYFL